jgi:hypothetical protein
MKINNNNNVVLELHKRNSKALDFVVNTYGGLIKSIVKKHFSILKIVEIYMNVLIIFL